MLLLSSKSLLWAQSVGDYRTLGTGVVSNWSVITSWQTWNGSAWVAAGAAPNSTNGAITIQSPDYITIAAAISIDQVVVNSGARLRTGANIVLTVANGAGVDLQVDGTFVDSSSGNISWTANSTWQMGASGTLIRCRGTSAATGWQNNYQGGISTIPSTGNWIIRKRDATNPIITTLSMFYPNLTIENYTGAQWVTATTSTFQGTTAFATVKGNLDIGGSGSNTVNFLNQNTFATPTLVQGNVTVRSGSTLSNNGTGLEVQGNITATGSLIYGASNGRKLIFSGSNAQIFSGAGTVSIYDMTMNKSSNNLTLNRAITVDNLLTLTSGIIYTTSSNLLTVNTNGNVSGASNSSFVSGPVRYVGNSAFTFPVGKGSDYQALGISSSAGSTTFWTETFNNGCTTGCLASGWTGTNGTWNVSYPTLNYDPGTYNVWYISCAENGNAVGSCGTGCGSNATLHMGSQTLGDIGAAYDAGGGCGFIYCVVTDQRAESPTINCTGYSNVVLAFNYIENGQGLSDNATVWYYDGATWSQIDDPPKTSTGCGGQGIWAARSITLPSSANNNPNVKIGFRWVNNDDGLGTDPSFAVNDVTLTQTGPTVDFTCEYFYSNPQVPYGNTLVPSLAVLSNCEYWILTRNAGTENKYVTLNWDANSCGIVNALTDVRVARYDGISTWQDEGNSSTTGSTSAGTVTSNLVTSFSPFTLASITPIVLPIELLDFKAKWNGSGVDLDWSTASETNNDYFTVERTADGKNFTEVTRVKGAGNSTVHLDYHTIDPAPLNGLSYYRLKQTDFDGKFSYSNLAPVTISGNGALEILNVSRPGDQLEALISCSCNGPLLVEVVDAGGKTIYSSAFSSQGPLNRIRIDTSKFSAGVYLLKVSDGREVKLKKFIL